MKILFVSNFYGEYCFQSLVAEILRQEGIEATFVTRCDVPEDPRAIPWTALRSAVDAGAIGRDLDSQVRDIEARYEVKLPEIYHSDLILPERPAREALLETVLYFRAWERFFAAHPIDAFFWFCDGDVIFRSAHYVARRRQIASYTRVPVPIPDSHAWLDNEFDVWDDFEDRPLGAIPEDHRRRVREYIRAVRERQVNLMLVRRPTANLLDHKVFQFLENIWFKLSRERRNPKWRPLSWTRQYLGKIRNEKDERSFYVEPDLSKPYVFFPLQKPKDIQLTVRAQGCSLERAALRTAEAAPPGWRVLVKGHPTWVGTYPAELFRRLKEKGNVDIVPAGYSAIDLIRSARAIVTVNNTIGYEAVLLRRPFVTVKPTYYSHLGHVAGTEDGIGEALGAALRRGFAATEADVERFVANLWSATYPGKSHFILNEKSELLTRRDIARTLDAYRRHGHDHGRAILAKLSRVHSKSSGGAHAHPART